MANSVPERIKEFWCQKLLSEFDEAIISWAEEMMDNPIKGHVYLIALTEGIKAEELLIFQDLEWYEKINIILLWEADWYSL